jgi:peptidoglycan-associated lipoprotein
MRLRCLPISAAALALSASVAVAQSPGTVEINGFGSYTKFDKSATGQDNVYGGGGRLGVFFLPNTEAEVEFDYSRIEFTNANGTKSKYGYAPIAARLNYNIPFTPTGSSSFFLGAGATRSAFTGLYNWGPSGIAGIRLGVGPVALRGDVSYAYLTEPKTSEIKGTVGLSILTKPARSYRADYASMMGMLPQPGTLEIGGFGQYSRYDEAYGVEQNGFGGGARVGAFITPNWELEGEGVYTKVDRTAPGFAGRSVHVSPVAGRINYNIPVGSRGSFILGAGASRLDVQAITYNVGASGLVGARVMLSPRFALRVDGLADYYPDPKTYNFGARAGISAFVGGAQPLPIPPIIVSLSPATASLMVGQTQPLTATATQEGRTLDRTFSCTSSDAAVATVDSNRVVTAVAPGTATITCTTGTQSATSTITVTAPPPPPAPVDTTPAVDSSAMNRGLTIYFDFDRSTIRTDARSILDSLIAKAKAGGTGVTVLVEGHTDSRGSDEYNLALGLRRANAAKRYMVANGVPARMVTIRSFGEECPAVANASTEDEYQQNRRDEFVVTIGGNTMQAPTSGAAKACAAPSRR